MKLNKYISVLKGDAEAWRLLCQRKQRELERMVQTLMAVTSLDGFTTLRIANVSRQAEWDTGTEPVSLAFRGNELAGEVGELCNVLKKLERERIGIVGSRATSVHAAAELADVVICADLIAMALGIDLGRAVREKFDATSAKYGLETRWPGEGENEQDDSEPQCLACEDTGYTGDPLTLEHICTDCDAHSKKGAQS